MSRALQVLIVDDSEDDAVLLKRCLQRAGFTPTCVRVDTGPALSEALRSRSWDLIISDHNMPDFSAPEALRLLAEHDLDLPFIIVSGSIGENAAVSAMKAGAQDYIGKDNLTRLPAAIERELKDADERRARRVAEERIRFLAYFDPLTSLPNRVQLCERVDLLLRDPQRAGAPLAVLGVKLEGLRAINNTLGHATGEQVLVEVAKRLHAVLEPEHLLARTGGADFAIVLPYGETDSAMGFARKVQQAISIPVFVDAMEVEVSAVLGVALAPDHGEDSELLLQRTSVALVQACESMSRIAFYDRERDPYQPRRLAMIAELRRAIETDQLSLQYQPKVGFVSGEMIGVEALVRWKHPKLGQLSPDTFIPLAEQTGLINPLTRWVFKEAMRQAYAWHRAGLGAITSVNLSARNLQSPELTDQLMKILSSSGIGADKLVLEVTESAIMSDQPRAKEILDGLHQRGIEISIDDFGTGYSSFANLRRLPVSEIKIDKSFVIGMSSSPEDRAIVDSVIGLGHKLGMNVVAEGVETHAAWNALASLSCDVAQGYYLSRPIAGGDLVDWTRGFSAPASEPPTAHSEHETA